MAKKTGEEETGLVRWEEELANEATAAAAMTAGVGGSKFMSVRGGVLTWAGEPVTGNRAAVIVLDQLLENVFYEGDFDPDAPASPKCFAFGRDAAAMAPHEVAVGAGTSQAESCAKCPQNAWGSSDKGKGKACKNTVRLAMLAAGVFNGEKFKAFDDPKAIAETELMMMKLPVTSVKGWATYVNTLKASLKVPPFGVVTRLSVRPDPKSQFVVTFESMTAVSPKIRASIIARRDEAKGVIDSPYSAQTEAQKPAEKKGKAKKGRY